MYARRGWGDPGSPSRSTLAHEIVIATRGQRSFGDRLVPQFQQVAGGMFTVRGYEQSIVAGDNAVIGSAEYRYHFARTLDPGAEPIELPVIGPFQLQPRTVFARPDWDLILKAFMDGAKTWDARADRPGDSRDRGSRGPVLGRRRRRGPVHALPARRGRPGVAAQQALRRARAAATAPRFTCWSRSCSNRPSPPGAPDAKLHPTTDREDPADRAARGARRARRDRGRAGGVGHGDLRAERQRHDDPRERRRDHQLLPVRRLGERGAALRAAEQRFARAQPRVRRRHPHRRRALRERHRLHREPGRHLLRAVRDRGRGRALRRGGRHQQRGLPRADRPLHALGRGRERGIDRIARGRAARHRGRQPRQDPRARRHDRARRGREGRS